MDEYLQSLAIAAEAGDTEALATLQEMKQHRAEQQATLDSFAQTLESDGKAVKRLPGGGVEFSI